MYGYWFRRYWLISSCTDYSGILQLPRWRDGRVWRHTDAAPAKPAGVREERGVSTALFWNLKCLINAYCGLRWDSYVIRTPCQPFIHALIKIRIEIVFQKFNGILGIDSTRLEWIVTSASYPEYIYPSCLIFKIRIFSVPVAFAIGNCAVAIGGRHKGVIFKGQTEDRGKKLESRTVPEVMLSTEEPLNRPCERAVVTGFINGAALMGHPTGTCVTTVTSFDKVHAFLRWLSRKRNWDRYLSKSYFLISCWYLYSLRTTQKKLPGIRRMDVFCVYVSKYIYVHSFRM